MTMRVVPSRTVIAASSAVAGAALAALVAGAPVALVSWLTAAALGVTAAAAIWDCVASRRAWRAAAPRMTRHLPAAFAVGVAKPVRLTIAIEGAHVWRCALIDHADPSLLTEGMPIALDLAGPAQIDTTYRARPTQRGEVRFEPAELRIRTRWRLGELIERLGATDVRRVYPDFAQVSRYAWLAGDRRLQEIGVKTYQLRGQGTDFEQLSEYRVGDPVRHIDWRATQRAGKPIVREFQDDRDQCVMLLVDCGRRMRADDRRAAIGTTHFDQVLNAVMLLTYVALKDGDAVGAMTFGTPPGEARSFAPRKGARALNELIGELYDIQPTTTHSDYVGAARELLRMQRKRALVIVITNFRDEDSTELEHALRLLRPRHLVLLASLRERVVGELMLQPLEGGDAAVETASAHLYEQSRRDAFHRLATGETLMVDAEPERLGAELVNRYHAVKRAGLI